LNYGDNKSYPKQKNGSGQPQKRFFAGGLRMTNSVILRVLPKNLGKGFFAGQQAGSE